MGDRDARTLSEGFSHFDAQDLQSLGIGEAIGRIEQAKYDFSLTIHPLPEIGDADVEFKINAIQEMSRAKYATPLTEFETSSSIGDHSETATHKSKLAGQKSKKHLPHVKKVKSDVSKGKGGDRHKEIQQQAAREKSFGADIEKHVGQGHDIDLVINTGNIQIACEISVTTTVEHELGNIQKCFTAGYTNIWMLAENTIHSNTIKSAVKNHLDSPIFEMIQFYSVDEALKEIRSINPEGKRIIRGRNVDFLWEDINPDELKRRQVTFAKSQQQT